MSETLKQYEVFFGSDVLQEFINQNPDAPIGGSPHSPLLATFDAAAKTYDELPAAARAGIDHLFELVEVPTEEAIAEVRAILNKDTPGVTANCRTLAYGETLLGMSVHTGIEMVRALLEAGADPNLEDTMDGETPYDKATEWVEHCIEYDLETAEAQAIVDLLLHAGALTGKARGERMVEQLQRRMASS